MEKYRDVVTEENIKLGENYYNVYKIGDAMVKEEDIELNKRPTFPGSKNNQIYTDNSLLLLYNLMINSKYDVNDKKHNKDLQKMQESLELLNEIKKISERKIEKKEKKEIRNKLTKFYKNINKIGKRIMSQIKIEKDDNQFIVEYSDLDWQLHNQVWRIAPSKKEFVDKITNELVISNVKNNYNEKLDILSRKDGKELKQETEKHQLEEIQDIEKKLNEKEKELEDIYNNSKEVKKDVEYAKKEYEDTKKAFKKEEHSNSQLINDSNGEYLDLLAKKANDIRYGRVVTEVKAKEEEVRKLQILLQDKKFEYRNNSLLKEVERKNIGTRKM